MSSTKGSKKTTNPQPQPDSSAPNGRDAAGRFTAGNKYGPGNPFARQTAELRKVLLEVVSPEEMRQVAFTLLLLAKAGKLEATRLLFQYVLGKPTPAVDPDRLDVEEWKLSQESKVSAAQVHETVQQMPAEAANLLLRYAWPAATETTYLSAAREELEAMDREDAERARGQEMRAETNGEDGGGAVPHPQPLSPQGRGEEGSETLSPEGTGQDEGDAHSPAPGTGDDEERGDGAARDGRSARPQATPHAEANGGNGGARPRPPRPASHGGKRQGSRPTGPTPAPPPKANGSDGEPGGHTAPGAAGRAPRQTAPTGAGRGAGAGGRPVDRAGRTP